MRNYRAGTWIYGGNKSWLQGFLPVDPWVNWGFCVLLLKGAEASGLLVAIWLSAPALSGCDPPGRGSACVVSAVCYCVYFVSDVCVRCLCQYGPRAWAVTRPQIGFL